MEKMHTELTYEQVRISAFKIKNQVEHIGPFLTNIYEYGISGTQVNIYTHTYFFVTNTIHGMF
jgi:hypothetical protein